MATYYKFLSPGRMAPYVDGFQWPEPGEWLEVSGPLVPCENGLHVLRWDQLIDWAWAEPELWTVEVDESEVIDHGDKVAVRRARLVARVDTWSERTAREFACACAERVLPIFERDLPGDDRPRRAIEVARRFARGEATDSELAAAWDAARDAARDAAWDAARDAAWAAARAAARDAAWDAARAAAWDAARDAAWDAARAAAWDAARDAAWAAARAAAWDAAWDAARDAAWAAARDAEVVWQHRHLADLLGIDMEG